MGAGSRGGGGGSVREWHDLSTWLSGSAAARLMLAGEGGGGADKVRAPTEPTALHPSAEGGRRRLCRD